MKIKIIYSIMIVFCLTSCKIRTSVILPIDSFESASDHNLIKKGIAKKEEIYLIRHELYKNSETKKHLKTIEKMCKAALIEFQKENITEAKYNHFAREANYVVRRALDLMLENNSSAEDDIVIQSLKQGIKTLNNILKQ